MYTLLVHVVLVSGGHLAELNPREEAGVRGIVLVGVVHPLHRVVYHGLEVDGDVLSGLVSAVLRDGTGLVQPEAVVELKAALRGEHRERGTARGEKWQAEGGTICYCYQVSIIDFNLKS